MRFSCKKCDTQYTIADEKARGKVIKIRCKRCSNLIVVRSSSPSDLPQSSPEEVAGVLHDSSLEMEFEHAFKEIYDSGLGRPPDEVIDEPAESSGEAGDEVEWYYGLDGAEEGPISFSQMKQHPWLRTSNCIGGKSCRSGKSSRFGKRRWRLYVLYA